MAEFRLGAGQVHSVKSHPDFQKSVALFRQNRFEEAEAICVKLGRQYSRDADLVHLRSVIAYCDKRLPIAIDLVKEALRLRPNDAAMLSDLGNYLLASGDYTEAENCLTQALQIAPRFAGSHFNMGSLASKTGDLRRAEHHFIQAYQCDPKMIVALFEVIDVQIELPRLQNARRNAEQIAKAYPDLPRAHALLAKVLAAQGEMAAAETALHRARVLAPDDDGFVFDQVGLLSQSGRMQEAAALLRGVLQREPQNLKAMMRLSRYDKLAHDDPMTNAMRQAAKSGKLSNGDSAQVHYALGKISEDNERYSEAFDFFRKGAEAKRKIQGVNFVGAAQSVADLRKTFTPELMARWENCGVSDETPVFVLGLPRSGTTLTEQVLSSHPSIAGAGELLELESTAQGVIRSAGVKSLGEALGKIGVERISEAAQAYLDVLKSFAPEAKRVVDKMPVNFNYVGLIAVLFPRATIVHCHRDILDTALSIFKNNFAGNTMWYSYDLDELAQFCRRYQQIMEIWDELLSGRIYRHDYDAMIRDQEGRTRALIDACGLEWSDACLTFHKNAQPVKTASVMQVRQPIYTKSLGLSARYGSALDPLREAFDRAGVVY